MDQRAYYCMAIERMSSRSQLTGAGAKQARPCRNGSDYLADERPQPCKVLPLEVSHRRSATYPWLRSNGTGQ